ncbi:hypothetical protein BKA69DRAFT_1124407 [Paraphysoderma sedebokerense]|nr:hypothetical protein BKA69DRAFT_1124407 [Paraphysoderma sedebokerense]
MILLYSLLILPSLSLSINLADLQDISSQKSGSNPPCLVLQAASQHCNSFMPAVIDPSDTIFSSPIDNVTGFDGNVLQVIQSFQSILLNRAKCPSPDILVPQFARTFWCSRILTRSAIRCQGREFAFQATESRSLESILNHSDQVIITPQAACNSVCKTYEESLVKSLVDGKCESSDAVLQDMKAVLGCGDSSSNVETSSKCIDQSNERSTCGYDPPFNCTCPPSSPCSTPPPETTLVPYPEPNPTANSRENSADPSSADPKSTGVIASVPPSTIIGVSIGVVGVGILFIVYKVSAQKREKLETIYYPSMSVLNSQTTPTLHATSSVRLCKPSKRTSSIIFSPSSHTQTQLQSISDHTTTVSSSSSLRSPSPASSMFSSFKSTTSSVPASQIPIPPIPLEYTAEQRHLSSSMLSLISNSTASTTSSYSVLPEPKTMIAAREYERSDLEDELPITIGAKYIVYAIYSDGWVWCKSVSTDQEGVLPSACLSDITDPVPSDAQSSSKIDTQSGQTDQASIFQATSDHIPDTSLASDEPAAEHGENEGNNSGNIDELTSHCPDSDGRVEGNEEHIVEISNS